MFDENIKKIQEFLVKHQDFLAEYDISGVGIFIDYGFPIPSLDPKVHLLISFGRNREECLTMADMVDIQSEFFRNIKLPLLDLDIITLSQLRYKPTIQYHILETVIWLKSPVFWRSIVKKAAIDKNREIQEANADGSSSVQADDQGVYTIYHDQKEYFKTEALQEFYPTPFPNHILYMKGIDY